MDNKKCKFRDEDFRIIRNVLNGVSYEDLKILKDIYDIDAALDIANLLNTLIFVDNSKVWTVIDQIFSKEKRRHDRYIINKRKAIEIENLPHAQKFKMGELKNE